MNVAERFGDNLKRQRKLADLSQDDLAFRASLHRTEISQLERGLRHARVDTVAKLAGAIEIDPGKLFEGIAWEPGDLRRGRFKPERSEGPLP
ncbi:MAG TPA: helix-turn-helix transcriptional regulator [Solirubrobacterales bacterium]|nr:helix-turn-helix transcriptional regulator [Solirubrobacterales bacterium]